MYVCTSTIIPDVFMNLNLTSNEVICFLFCLGISLEQHFPDFEFGP